MPAQVNRPHHVNGRNRSGTTRRRAYPGRDSLTVAREDAKYGKRGNSPSPRGKKRV